MHPTLLLTRPRAQAERFAQACQARFEGRAKIVLSPILSITLRDVTLPLPDHAVLIFSSQNAVDAFCQTGVGLGRTAYCVGDRTAAAAKAAGLAAISAGGTAQDLLARILADAPRAPLVYLHGETIRVDITKPLRDKGFGVTSEVVYAQTPRDLTLQAQQVLDGPAPAILPIFSPRSAQLLAAATATAQAPLYVAALSDNVAQAWTRQETRIDAKVVIAQQPNAHHMLESIESTLIDTLP